MYWSICYMLYKILGISLVNSGYRKKVITTSDCYLFNLREITLTKKCCTNCTCSKFRNKPSYTK